MKQFLVCVCLLLAGCVSPGVQAGYIETPSGLAPTQTNQAPIPTGTPTPAPQPSATPTLAPSPTAAPVYFTGAGDISICGQDGDDQTAKLLANIPGQLFTAGDNSNEDGAEWQYTRCFEESWGQFKDRLRPAPGNHDYNTPGAQPYFAYFGAAAGNPGEGWYSYDYGGWHIIVLNSNCNDVACGKNSPQVTWLREDLAASDALCTLAIWHHPRWSSGMAGSDGRMSAAFRALYEAGAEIVISGHDHDYERLAPLDADGKRDPERGIRQFVVGTGGAYFRPFLNLLPESEANKSFAFGVLRFTLRPDSYDWKFIPIEGVEYEDSGSGVCHE